MSFLRRKARLKTSYRDQMIRELQHLRAHKDVAISAEVNDLMEAVMREHARRQEVASRPFLRRWKGAHSVRRDDAILASDLYLLEATLIEHMDEEELKIRLAGFRDLLSHLLTKESHDSRTSQLGQRTGDSRSVDQLRGEAKAIASEIYRRYEGVPAVENARVSAANWVLATAMILTGAAWVGSEVFYQHLAPVFAMAVAGSIGAAVSTVERLYRLDPKEDPFKMSLALDSAWFTLLLAPVLGAIFALVLFLIFRAGLIEGILFPHFGACWDFLSIKLAPAPNAACEQIVPRAMAMLIAWGFLAGWAERLVPDVLDKLAPRAATGIKSK
ncbi:MAG: hypothetical protein M3Q42_02435 [Pseudomonadota bacterium]|nr:hypothetical protein [Pseudomonadota bacterium]